MRCASAIISWNGSGEARDFELRDHPGAPLSAGHALFAVQRPRQDHQLQRGCGSGRESIPSDVAARLAIVAALCIEIIMPLGIVTGVADRLAAFILAGYCGITALLWKQFWKPGDFWSSGSSRARDLFWDFLKNFSLAGGILLITFGTDTGQVAALLSHPQLSSHPYSAHQSAH